MLRNWVGVSLVSAAISVVSCGGGAGESGSAADASSDMPAAELPIIALDDVKPSQSGAVMQEIANTSITVWRNCSFWRHLESRCERRDGY